MTTSTLLESSIEAQRAAADTDERDRKLEHIELSLDPRIQMEGRFFDRLTFEHEALPDVNLDAISMITIIF